MGNTATKLIRRLAGAVALAAALAVSSACTLAPTFTVAVDAIAAPAPQDARRYVLKPVVAGVDDGDLRFLEFAGHIHRTLAPMGFIQVADAGRADIEIEVNYGAIRDEKTLVLPRHRSRLHRPVRHCRHRDASGRCRLWRDASLRHHRHALEHYRDEIRVVPYYRVFIALEAYAIAAASAREELWSTRARADTARPDLRRAFPLLLAAASPYIGADTGREITVVLDRDDLRAHGSGG